MAVYQKGFQTVGNSVSGVTFPIRLPVRTAMAKCPRSLPLRLPCALNMCKPECPSRLHPSLQGRLGGLCSVSVIWPQLRLQAVR